MKKLYLNNDLVARLDQLKQRLAQILPMEDMDKLHGGDCGGFCYTTCSQPCTSSCSDMGTGAPPPCGGVCMVTCSQPCTSSCVETSTAAAQ